MSDIVERLCHPSRVVPTDGNTEMRLHEPQVLADMAEAAAEIERLRATIELLRSVAGAISIEDVSFDQIKKDARS